MRLEKIFKLSDIQLKKALREELISRGYDQNIVHTKSKFLYAEGNAPYMLVAHLDTVHKEPPSIICYSNDGNYIMSPQGIGGDDRCGVYIILSLIRKLSFRPYIVFTMEEETGGIGANAFADYITNHDAPELKYIVEFDRKGNRDCVFYHCDNDDFSEFVQGFGFTEARGTFSDISIIAPALGVAAVNLSSGYYNPHTEHEYVSMTDMNYVINATYKMLNTECDAFEYIESYSSMYSSRRVSVTFLPKDSVVIEYRSGCSYYNDDKEIAVDQLGNYYRYNARYRDLTGIWYATITPAYEGAQVQYNPRYAQSFPMCTFD